MSAEKRIQWLHKYIVNMRYPNASRLSERFGISHRQAQRDVTSLREDYGAPLAYSAEHRGFYYTEEYALPSYTEQANEFDYVEAVAGEASHGARQEILQMQIPYTARLRITDKLTQLELGRFIAEKKRGNEFVCEFHNIEIFLGALFTAKTPITVLEPDWLRERLIDAATRILKSNNEE